MIRTNAYPAGEGKVQCETSAPREPPSPRCYLFNWPRCAMFKQYLLRAKTGTFIFAVDPAAFSIFPRHWRSTTIIVSPFRDAPLAKRYGRNHAGGSCFLIIETSISEVERGTLDVYWPFIVRQIKKKKFFSTVGENSSRESSIVRVWCYCCWNWLQGVLANYLYNISGN